MDELEEEPVVVCVRIRNKVRWYRSDRDLWVLDINKWRDEFIARGYDVPEFQEDYRFGIPIVNRDTAEQFLTYMSEFELPRDRLSVELAGRYVTARSWWDVADLFPIMFVDFDSCKVAGFYPDGTAMERYVPDGWEGEFVDFANDYPEEILPTSEKFWVKGGSDLLKLLNERGAGSQV